MTEQFETMYFAGVEGGGTGSNLVLLNEAGDQLATVIGPPTNPLLIGREESFKRIQEMVSEAKLKAKLVESQRLRSLGLCLSGVITEHDCESYAAELMKYLPEMSENCVAANDTVGSVYTTNLKAGVVLISGTGSNSIQFSENGQLTTCGGWGHLFGDEGSAYWISWRAYKTLLDDNDNFIAAKYDTKRIRDILCSHFKLDSEHQIGYFYQMNDKRAFASLSKELYKSTKLKHDEAIDDIFCQAGAMLARKVLALMPKVDKETIDAGLNIVCVGAVFNSWDLLESGFVSLLSQHLKNFRLLKLKRSSAYGAAKYAAMKVSFELPIGQTTELLYAYSATSNGYLANGHHVSSSGARNGNGSGNNGHSQQQQHHHHQQVVAQERERANCKIV